MKLAIGKCRGVKTFSQDQCFYLSQHVRHRVSLVTGNKKAVFYLYYCCNVFVYFYSLFFT